MSAVRDRWEVVEPLLFAHALRDPSAFRRGTITRTRGKDLEALRSDHRFEDSAIARAFNLLADADPSPLDHDETVPEPLHLVIRETATRWLVVDGDHWALRVERRRPGHEIIRWRGVTMLLPPSIVIAGALSATQRSHPCWVQALPDSIAPKEPVGHLHVHLGPMLPFEALWLQLWNAFLQHGTLDARKNDGIASIKDVPEIGRHTSKRQPGIRWQWMLELAFAARVWLSQILRGESAPLPPVLRGFSRGKIDLDRRAGALLALWSEKDWRSQAKREARRLAQSRLRHERRKRTLRSHAANAQPATIRADVAMSAPCDGDDEVVFLAEALRRCGEPDRSYAAVLYQYLRVKVALYQSLVVDPWTTGLRHFLDVVQHDGPYKDVIDDDRRLDEARLDGARTEKPLRVDALEIHIAPKSWLKRSLREPHHRHTWVLSFPRAKDPRRDDPSGARATAEWRRATAEGATMCRLLARRIAMRPSLLREIRGLSLMHWERNGPVWLFETAFRRLIDASVEVAAGHPRLGLRPLQTALHLGEDFDHILSGLRQIFEPFEWGLIRRGDRIGHALALGLSPDAWCEANPWIRMRPWDRILDIGFLVWAFEKLTLPAPPNALERMRVNALEALHQVFGGQHGDALETARNLWLSLPQRALNGSNRNHAQPDRLAEARALKARVLDDRSVGRRALSLSLTVETKLDLSMIQVIRQAIFEHVAKWQVAIEVNPSSNLLIGGFRSIFHQPVFHTDDLPILLNTDDPLTFGTTLADEYAYAWAGMVIGSGQSPHQATRRLEEAAHCSMRYVFTERRAVESPGRR